jgi:hypothetical protein
MQGPLWTSSVPPSGAETPAPSGSLRDRLAVLVALVTFACVGLAFLLAKDTQFLMPGPLASVHSAIGNCNVCHTKSGTGKLSWMHGLVAGDPLADSEACLTCHRMPDTAFHAHGASDGTLAQSTKRLEKVGARTRAPGSVRAQSAAFPTDDKVARGLYCATCHQEHQGVNFNLAKISSEQCHSCHVVKFDSFDGRHPQFENYPFKRRTRIIYDHAGHFGKHFPDVAKKGLARRVPATCSTCHDSRKDKRIMAVAPFEQTCTACHLDQITGKERVSGPKGIAFLTLPGLDLGTLKEKNASIGEWPAASEAELTPFMKVMIARTERGRALIKTVDSLNLQDLSGASDDQIQAVTNLVWEVKRLFYALIAGKASDVLADLGISCGAKLSAGLVADLTASIPRDVVIGAYQQWLPNLGTEMANRRDASDQEPSCVVTTRGGWITTLKEPRAAGDSDAAGTPKRSRPTQADQQIQTRNAPDAGAAKASAALPERAAGKADTANASPDDGAKAAATDKRPPNRPADQTDDLLNPTEEELRATGGPGGAAVRGFTAQAGPGGGRIELSVDERPRAITPGAKDAEKVAQADGAARRPAGSDPRAADQTDDLLNPTQEELRGIAATIESAEKAIRPEGKKTEPETAAPKAPAANTRPEGGIKPAAADEQRPNRAADQTDDLLDPTQEGAPSKGAERAVEPEAGAGKTETTKPDSAASAEGPSSKGAAMSTEAPATRAAPVISIESDVDPESWAEYGGWYRQDYGIFYRPTGHKDKFIYSWLFLTGPQAPKGDKSPAAAVFDSLASNVAQGACTKCHSVDDVRGGRTVNFSPVSSASKQGRFTSFIHEPHFGILENRGCLTCHNLEKNSPYPQSYKAGNPRNFASNFGAVDKELCQTCHTRSIARQDCLLCHKYHVNGVVTPMMNTRIPTE